MILYTCVCLLITATTCGAAAFSRRYDANTIQRVALSFISTWCVWRSWLMFDDARANFGMAVIATGLALFSVGSICKTMIYAHKEKKHGTA